MVLNKQHTSRGGARNKFTRGVLQKRVLKNRALKKREKRLRAKFLNAGPNKKPLGGKSIHVNI